MRSWSMRGPSSRRRNRSDDERGAIRHVDGRLQPRLDDAERRAGPAARRRRGPAEVAAYRSVPLSTGGQPMEFGIFNLMGSREASKPTAQVFGEVAEQTKVADELGYTIAWFAEHHFSNYCLCASPLMMVAHCASITKRIRLGTADVVCLCTTRRVSPPKSPRPTHCRMVD